MNIAPVAVIYCPSCVKAAVHRDPAFVAHLQREVALVFALELGILSPQAPRSDPLHSISLSALQMYPHRQTLFNESLVVCLDPSIVTSAQSYHPPPAT